ncbi:endonuclease domain-containing protein [Lewinella cohaerens]|uniref:endonuclease domain-containing protein n=1 Tax=Lewinella cohaerens TaxID=70995 RepID=UPI00037D1F05|nr:endonuclease domain-containing protein [Lewinella cohaerens]
MKHEEAPRSWSHYNYNRHLKDYANHNRKHFTKSAAALWKYALRNRNMLGYQFRRERPIGFYIADFACLPIGLVIEVDGITHQNKKQKAYDKRRDLFLADLGFTTLRFSSSRVLNDMEGVKFQIATWIEEHATVPPPKPRRRRKKKE